MKAAKRIAIALLVYLAIVVTFESLIGFFQPANQSTLVLTAVDQNGDSNDRVLARVESDGKLYVSVNHWPRAWYRNVLANPNVEVTLDGEKGAYRAVSLPVDGAEFARVDSENGLPIPFRILTGFPMRYLLRLDPQPGS